MKQIGKDKGKRERYVGTIRNVPTLFIYLTFIYTVPIFISQFMKYLVGFFLFLIGT